MRPAAGSRQAEDDIGAQVQVMAASLERVQINPRKRPAGGHKAFDLAKCQKVIMAVERRDYFQSINQFVYLIKRDSVHS